jgi:MFS family permease
MRPQQAQVKPAPSIVESGEVLVYFALQGIMSARIFGLRFSVFYAFLTIGLGMQLPFLPLWLHAKGLSVGEIGLVIAGMTASRFVAIPVAAYFADRYRNRRGLIILFSLASAFGYLLLGLSSGFLPILANAILASVCIAPIFTLAESFSVDGSAHHGLDYGRLRLWGSISFLLGNLGAGALLLHIPHQQSYLSHCPSPGRVVSRGVPAAVRPGFGQAVAPGWTPRQYLQRLRYFDDGQLCHFHCCREPGPGNPWDALFLRPGGMGQARL